MLEVMSLEKRDREEDMELDEIIRNENDPTSTSENNSSVRATTIGRQSGGAEWKAVRGEDGTQN
jgi:hypothetical protein